MMSRSLALVKNQIIQGLLDGLESEGIKLVVVPVEVEEEAMVVEVADEVSQDRGLEVEVPIKWRVEGGGWGGGGGVRWPRCQTHAKK